MKKTTFILVIITILSLSLRAQNAPTGEKEELKVEVIRDRLMVDVFHSFWFGMPSQVNSMKFDPGFNVSILWDFKNNPKKPISFGLGLGTTYYTLFSDAILKYDKPSGLMRFNVLPMDTMAKLNRTTYINCNIPLEFRYRHQNGFKVTVGIRVGITAEISHRYKGLNPDGSGLSLNTKDFDIKSKMKFNFDTYFRMGWKYVSFYYCYQVTSLFEKGKGPKIMPMSIGITWNVF
ncbi:MAG: hypothetical protein LBU51_09600 [Bacteroidales bacterium]|jgi:hypothetical protein|nr:hypothetical protein [Bacteroidales bacterium]